MRIVIDMQGAQTGSRYRGIGRYTVAFTKSLIENAPSNYEFVLLFNALFKEDLASSISIFENLVPKENIKLWFSYGPVNFMFRENDWRREAAEYLRESVIFDLKPDLVLLTTTFEGFGDDFVLSVGKYKDKIPTVGILYDLIPLLNESEYLQDRNVRAWYFNKLDCLKKCDFIFSISGSSRKEAIEHLSCDAEKVFNISAGVDPVFCIRKDCKEGFLREKFHIKREIISYTSATDPRKNHKRLIDAYSSLSIKLRSKHQLVFVGGMPREHSEFFTEYAKKAGMGKDELIITGRVTDEEMSGLYQISKAFVFPSWHEGFGLPALEAILCGCPVIASSVSSLPEVVGCDDALFDPFNTESIKHKIERVLSDEPFRSQLTERQLHHSRKFSWDNSAVKAIEAIEQFFADKSIYCAEDRFASRGHLAGYRSLIDSISEINFKSTDEDVLGVSRAIDRNERLADCRQLFVDVSELIKVDSETGIQRVTRSILKHLLSTEVAGVTIEPVYASEHHGYLYAKKFTANFLNERSHGLYDRPIEFWPGDVFLGLDLIHPKIAVANIKNYELMRDFGVKVYFVIYDLVPIQFPDFSNVGVTEGHRDWLNVVVGSDGLLCISRSVARDLLVWFGERSGSEDSLPPISWFHLGADVENSVPSKGLPRQENDFLRVLTDNPTFLMVGTVEPRKGHAVVLDAFDTLWSKGVDVNLVIVGKQGWLVEKLVERLQNHRENGKRLFWLSGVSDEYLEKIYTHASCLIAASYGEGFGLPLIEAAQHKLPIIARDIPVFREVAGKHAYYFDKDDSHNLAVMIHDWLELFEEGRHPTPDKIKWLTWKESGQQLLNLIFSDNLRMKETMKEEL